ncbi:hypothetical protein psyc5s11_24780 [Clostridium gelidum]|uniref:Uncharacterized protein n=1 Tax=Clostridium gelidum TaxID=704125 RepID=A0ABN6J0D3_9CLOT|nr:hypothetical protein psyc5s11_24780 [Clostridium gelidum]
MDIILISSYFLSLCRFKWLELFENDKESVKVKNFMVQCNVAYAYTKTADSRERETIFV